MQWEATERIRPVGELSSRHTFAGLTFGDNWVCAHKAHADQTGAVFPYASNFGFAHGSKPGTTPNRKELLRLAVRCWKSIDTGSPADYSGFLVCLPGWACRTQEVTVQLALDQNDPAPGRRERTVDAGHLNDLVARVAAEVEVPGMVLVEIVPHDYLINGRRRLMNPLGTPARSIKLRAHVVVAEESCVYDIMYCLRHIGVRRVSAFLSPFSVAGSHLSLAERQRDVTVVEIDRRSTNIGFYRGGELVRSACIAQGSYNLLVEAAEGLGMRAICLARWVNEWERLFVSPSFEGAPEHHVFSRRDDSPESLEALDRALSVAGTRLAGLIMDEVRDANFRLDDAYPDMILLGEDYLSLRAVKTILDREPGVRASWRIPAGTHPENGGRVTMPGLVRIFGAMRIGDELKQRPEVPVLHEYNQTRIDRVNDRLYSWGSRMARRARRVRMRRVAQRIVQGTLVVVAALSFGRIRVQREPVPSNKLTHAVRTRLRLQ